MALTGDIYQESTDDNQNAKQQALTEAALANHNEEINNEQTSHGGDDSNTQENVSRSQVGVGVLAGITGLFLGGPILGAITGGGAYYLAANNENGAGDAARRAGDWAVKTGSKVAEAAKEADERHNVFDKFSSFFTHGWSKICQFDEKHRASERVKETVSEVGARTMEFEKQHHVMENILEGIKGGIDFLLQKLKGATGNNDSNTQINETS